MLQKKQRHLGHSFVSRTSIYTLAYGRNTAIVALRAVISNPLTSESDIEEILNEQVEIVDSFFSA